MALMLKNGWLTLHWHNQFQPKCNVASDGTRCHFDSPHLCQKVRSLSPFALLACEWLHSLGFSLQAMFRTNSRHHDCPNMIELMLANWAQLDPIISIVNLFQSHQIPPERKGARKTRTKWKPCRGTMFYALEGTAPTLPGCLFANGDALPKAYAHCLRLFISLSLGRRSCRTSWIRETS